MALVSPAIALLCDISNFTKLPYIYTGITEKMPLKASINDQTF